ncbi:uncharacterized protein I303_100553 [Kwoniella dejecticola CBS 10117]|uniref:Uncharacterized protein n=1 Tax=Kwoniella dejecticola CBS 10117 TaxID=1296121 RepID=A0A1A6AF85_9TREE|nr:uncharacterized protein I303_00554 [Kwoniella dejecticola CBS 10117]OBR88737.1 hypothetical protein I303_00554 [Kwoniella dejecticola CBS 10117]
MSSGFSQDINYIVATGFVNNQVGQGFQVEFTRDESNGPWKCTQDTRIGTPSSQGSLPDDREFTHSSCEEPLGDLSTPSYMKYKWRGHKAKEIEGGQISYEGHYHFERKKWKQVNRQGGPIDDDGASMIAHDPTYGPYDQWYNAYQSNGGTRYTTRTLRLNEYSQAGTGASKTQ